jgi:hypothetical protein
LSYWRGTYALSESFNLTYDQVANYVEERAASPHKILAKYATADEYDPRKRGKTTLLQFMSQLAQECTHDEALQIYTLAAKYFPDYRWTHYSRRLCPTSQYEWDAPLLQAYLRDTSQYEWDSALLQAYLRATSQSFMTFFRMLLSKQISEAKALSVSTMDILYVTDFGFAGVSRWRPGTYKIWNLENC